MNQNTQTNLPPANPQPAEDQTQIEALMPPNRQIITDRLRALEPQIARYMDLAVRFGVNIQPDQELRIECERTHADLAYRVARAAYERGAKFVEIDYLDPMLTKIRVEHTKDAANLGYFPDWQRKRVDHWVDAEICRLYLAGDENPDLLSSCDPGRLATVRQAARASRKRYFDEGINQNKVQWSIAAVPTERWAQKVYPSLPPEEAYLKLWETILKVCRVDTPDWENRWSRHDATLQGRAEKLNALGIKSLHFTGPGTDFSVGLTATSIFAGGSELSTRGARFYPNIPTEEVFTTPDWRLTEGVVRATRPVFINDTLVDGLEMEFQKGELVRFKARAGEAAFAKHIEADAGARRAGEVALVGIDSPIYESGVVYEETLFDENALCHFAIGGGYAQCVKGGTTASKEELAALGVNDSLIHDDIMISSPEVDVTGTLHSGDKVQLLAKGRFVGDLAAAA